MPEQTPSRAYVWYVILLLSVVNACNYMDRMALAVLSPLIQSDLHLSDSQLGLLVGFAFSLFYAICGIPIARWADRGIRRDIIAVAVATWSVMTALCGAAQNFWHLFLARVGVGAGEAGSIAPGASIACDYVPVSRRSGALAVMAFGTAVGILVGMALAGLLGEKIGWRWTFVALGLPGVLLALLVKLTLKEPRRGTFDANNASVDATQTSLRATAITLWQCRSYRLITLFLVVNGFVQYGLNQWWPSFYAREFSLGLSTLGLYLGLAVGVSSGLGVLIGGVIGMKSAQRDITLPLKITAAVLALSMLTALSSLFVSSVEASIALVAITGLFWGVSNGPVLSAQYSVVHPSIRATAGSMTIFLTSVLGFGLGPLSVGFVSDLLAPDLGTQSLRYALVCPILLTALMIFALLAVCKVLRADLAMAGERNTTGGTDSNAAEELMLPPIAERGG